MFISSLQLITSERRRRTVKPFGFFPYGAATLLIWALLNVT
jgi:hypothetical protein